MKLSVIVPSLTGNVPRSVAALCDRVELVVVSGVSPVAAARNEGLSRATGDYIAWVDADDEVTEDWLDAILEALVTQPDLVTFNVWVEWHDESGRASYELNGSADDHLWCKVFRRTLFDGLRFEGAVHEDWRIQCQMPRKLTHRHIDKVLYVYQRTATGLSQHRDVAAEWKALWELVKICNSWEMFCGICERFWDFAKTPLRRLFR